MAMSNRAAQSTVEYAILAAVVVAALLVVQIYMKRGFSGKLKESTDRVGEQFTPATATHDIREVFDSTRHERMAASGTSEFTIVGQEKQTRSGKEDPSKANDSETLWSR